MCWKHSSHSILYSAGIPKLCFSEGIDAGSHGQFLISIPFIGEILDILGCYSHGTQVEGSWSVVVNCYKTLQKYVREMSLQMLL